MSTCKAIGLFMSLAGVIITIAGMAQKAPWVIVGAALTLIGRIVSEKFPEWFDL